MFNVTRTWISDHDFPECSEYHLYGCFALLSLCGHMTDSVISSFYCVLFYAFILLSFCLFHLFLFSFFVYSHEQRCQHKLCGPPLLYLFVALLFVDLIRLGSSFIRRTVTKILSRLLSGLLFEGEVIGPATSGCLSQQTRAKLCDCWRERRSPWHEI